MYYKYLMNENSKMMSELSKMIAKVLKNNYKKYKIQIANEENRKLELILNIDNVEFRAIWKKDNEAYIMIANNPIFLDDEQLLKIVDILVRTADKVLKSTTSDRTCILYIYERKSYVPLPIYQITITNEEQIKGVFVIHRKRELVSEGYEIFLGKVKEIDETETIYIHKKKIKVNDDEIPSYKKEVYIRKVTNILKALYDDYKLNEIKDIWTTLDKIESLLRAILLKVYKQFVIEFKKEIQ